MLDHPESLTVCLLVWEQVERVTHLFLGHGAAVWEGIICLRAYHRESGWTLAVLAAGEISNRKMINNKWTIFHTWMEGNVSGAGKVWLPRFKQPGFWLIPRLTIQSPEAFMVHFSLPEWKKTVLEGLHDSAPSRGSAIRSPAGFWFLLALGACLVSTMAKHYKIAIAST